MYAKFMVYLAIFFFSSSLDIENNLVYLGVANQFVALGLNTGQER